MSEITCICGKVHGPGEGCLELARAVYEACGWTVEADHLWVCVKHYDANGQMDNYVILWTHSPRKHIEESDNPTLDISCAHSLIGPVVKGWDSHWTFEFLSTFTNLCNKQDGPTPWADIFHSPITLCLAFILTVRDRRDAHE